ncbi:MAG: glycosyltransferase family 1 protein, partial [Coleofasciculaceae cyanobacterium]
LSLALQMRQYYGINTHFIVGDQTWTGEAHIEGFNISKVPIQSTQKLLSLLESKDFLNAVVLLHYVNYGYAKRGCPIWLVEGLQRWQNTTVKHSLITMFHEVYACGFPPWNSSFWLSPLQKRLASQLAQLSDSCFTSRKEYATLLYKLSRGKHSQISTLPVFSNVGEQKEVLPLEKRDKKIIIFGSSAMRKNVYKKSSSELLYACKLLEIEEIIDIGPSTQLIPTIGSIPIIEMGQLPAPTVSKILSHSLAGFFNYIPGYLAKSTIFAAYCSHGMLPISARYNPSQLDGIEAGKQYWIPENSRIGAALNLQAIANFAHVWYQAHQLSIQAKLFADQIYNLA